MPDGVMSCKSHAERRHYVVYQDKAYVNQRSSAGRIPRYRGLVAATKSTCRDLSVRIRDVLRLVPG